MELAPDPHCSKIDVETVREEISGLHVAKMKENKKQDDDDDERKF